MSVYITLDEAEPNFLASNTGWAELGAWIDTLPADEFVNLIQLRDYGLTEPANQLHKQLVAAFEKHKPADENTQHVIADLLDLLKRETETVVGVSQGVMADTEAAPPHKA